MLKGFCALFLCLFCFSDGNGQAWEEMGSGIYGASSGDKAGNSVSISSDNKTVAVGSPENNGTGQVRVFSWNGNSWNQKGAVIEGDSANDYAGQALALSNNGNVLAVGIPRSNANGNTNSGKVRIYSWNGTGWVQRGNALNGEAEFNYFGFSVDLTASGDTIAIGAPLNNSSNNNAGHVKIYTWEGGSWTQIGNAIPGGSADERSGEALSLNSSGSLVAIGAPRNSENETQAGKVRVYNWDGAAWVQRGNDLNGLSSGDRAGSSLDMSSGGDVLAIGAPLNGDTATNTGHARVFTWDGSSWNQQGNDFYGVSGDNAGKSVALNANGNTLAIGAPGNDSGKVRIFDWDGSAWNQKGSIVKGEESVANLGESVDLNRSGNAFAAGAGENDGNGTNSGKVSVYSFCTPTTSSFSDTGCTAYTVPSGDETYYSDTTVMDTIYNAAGCDSIMTISVTFEENTSSTISRTTCGPYIVPSGDEKYLLSGTYTDTIPNSVGCDSIITINLSTNNSDTTIQPVACGSYTVPSGDETYTQSGTYTDTLINSSNCDSLITIDLTLHSSTRDTIDTTLCANAYTVPSGDETHNSDGTYYDTIPNVHGCDSILRINLTLLEQHSIVIDTTFCGYRFTVPSGDTTYTSNGTYRDTLTNNAGCDSVLTFNVTMNNSRDTLDITTCSQYTVPSNDTTYHEGGTYMDTIANNAGCDSILTINLTLNSTDTSFERTICKGSYTVPSGDTTFTSTDSVYNHTYIDTMDNAVGCDSIITIDVLLRHPTSSTLDIASCYSYSPPGDDTTYYEGGTYMDTIPNYAGCDSVITINLSIDTVNTTVTKIDSNASDRDTLFAETDGDAYQWLDCESGYSQIRNETDSMFSTKIGGSYAVEIKRYGCTDTSECFTLSSVTGILKNDFGTDFKVYPNPTSGRISVNLGKRYSGIKTRLVNSSGQIVKKKTVGSGKRFDMTIRGSSGVYMLMVETLSGKRAFMKIVKQ